MLLGYRHYHHSLVDMRIHDINVVADLNRHNPNAPNPDDPVDSDGTATGYKPALAAISFVDMLIDMATANTISWWTGWWPLLHTRTTSTLASGAFCAYQVAVDLFGTPQLEEFSMNTPEDDHLTDGEITALAQGGVIDFLAEGFTVEMVLFISATVLMGVIDILLFRLTTVPTPAELGVLAVLIGLYVIAMFEALKITWDGVMNRRIPAAIAFGILAAVLVTLVAEGTLAGLNAFKIFKEYWNKYKSASYIKRARVFVALSIFIVFIKLLLLGIVLSMMVRCWEYWLGGY